MDSLTYFNNEQLLVDIFTNKYLGKKESTPIDSYKRCANKFWEVESQYLEIEKEKQIITYKPMSYDWILNAFLRQIICLSGSVLSNLGNKDYIGSLSNCFAQNAPHDSYAGILEKDEALVQLMKRRGGVGMPIHTLRPENAKVNNAAKTSTGAVSFMDRYSNTTNEVAQNGRRGALLLMMMVNHPDIIKFVTKKQDLTKVTGANISVGITNDFMEAVINDSDYFLKWPIDIELTNDIITEELVYNTLYEKDGIYCAKVKAKEIWNTIITCAHNTGEPGIIFVDNHLNYSLDTLYSEYKGVVTNPCQPAFATVLTPVGISTIGEVNIGDIIWSGKQWTKITNKWPTGIKSVNEYKTRAGSFIGTKKHRIVQNGIKTEVKDAISIDFCTNNIVLNNTFNLQDIVDGLVIGDGSYHKASNNLIYLCIGENDNDYFNSEIKDYILSDRRIAFNNHGWEINTTIKYEELDKTYNRVIPERFFKGNFVKVKSFLRGLYSANGSIVDNRITIKQSSFEMIKQIQMMLSALGIRSYYTVNKSKSVNFENGVYKCKESYDLNITKDRSIFAEKIGFIQKYKTDKLNYVLSTINISNKPDKSYEIKSIDNLGEHEVFDLTVEAEEHTYWSGGLLVSNCGEIWMSGDETCRLIHINISKFVINPYTNEAVFDYKRFYDYCYNMMKLVDDLVDLEIEAISKIIDSIVENYNPVQERELALWKRIKTKTIASRRAGAGSLGWADTLAMLGLPYDSNEDTLTFIHSIAKVKLKAEFDASMDRADAHGAFENCDVDMEWNSGNGFMENTIKNIYSKEQWLPRRNVSISTIAPTGTISQLAQATSGLEPVFEIAYIRNVKCEDDAIDFDFQDDVGRRFKSYKIYHPPVKDFFKVNPTATEKDIPWISANNVNYRDRINIQSVLQKYTSHSISSTINLPNNATVEQVGEIYMEAWKANLKGLTVYRDGCRTGILVTENQSDKKNVPMDRPKELKAFFHSVRVNGIKYGVMVGLLNDLPYEIFAVKTDIKTREIEGKLVKVNKDRYDFIGGNIHIENINTTSQEEKAITLLASIALRNGAPRKEILKTIEKISANVTDFGAAIGRILKKYSFNDGESESCPNCGGKIIYENGCKTCRECGYSGCS